jgi:hypothetical protein
VAGEARPSAQGQAITNTAATKSTACWIGACLACADSTICEIFGSMPAAPIAVVRTTREPSPLMAPPVSVSLGWRVTGRLSLVSSDLFRWLRPLTTTPSVGTRSPGRISTSSPGSTSASGRDCSIPARRTLALSGRIAFRPSSATRVPRLARASSQLPNNTKVITTAAPSNDSCGMAPGSLAVCGAPVARPGP